MQGVQSLHTLEELGAEMRRLAVRLRTPTDGIPPVPALGYGDGDGSPYVMVDHLGYHYIMDERGTERCHVTTRDLDELMFVVFERVTESLFYSRGSSQSCSRAELPAEKRAYQTRMLGAIDPRWAERFTRKAQ